MTLALYITIQTPPPGLDYALQKGHGSKIELIQIQRSTGQDLHFNWVIDVKGDKQKDSNPGFGGPFVQGAPPEKFLYVNIGTYAGQQFHSGWRLKVPLRGITWQMLEQTTAGLETIVQGTAKNGAPTCATVKPFDGWKIKTAV